MEDFLQSKDFKVVTYHRMIQSKSQKLSELILFLNKIKILNSKANKVKIFLVKQINMDSQQILLIKQLTLHNKDMTQLLRILQRNLISYDKTQAGMHSL